MCTAGFPNSGGTLRRGDHQRAASVGDQAALQEVERVGHHPGGQYVLDRNRVGKAARVLRRPAPLGHGDVGQLLMGQPVLLDRGDLELQGDFVADQDAAGLQRGVPGDAVVLAVDGDDVSSNIHDTSLISGTLMA